MNEHMIIGLHIKDRVNRVGDVQKVLTEYGSYIRARIGLHDVHDDKCSPNGLILLQIHGDERIFDEIAGKLNAIKGVEVKKMVFGTN